MWGSSWLSSCWRMNHFNLMADFPHPVPGSASGPALFFFLCKILLFSSPALLTSCCSPLISQAHLSAEMFFPTSVTLTRLSFSGIFFSFLGVFALFAMVLRGIHSTEDRTWNSCMQSLCSAFFGTLSPAPTLAFPELYLPVLQPLWLRCISFSLLMKCEYTSENSRQLFSSSLSFSPWELLPAWHKPGVQAPWL